MTIIWNRIDQPGKEWFRLRRSGSARILEGVVVLAYDQKPCHLAYTIECDGKWQTRAVSVTGQIGNRPASVRLRVNSKGQWLMQGKPVASVQRCIDVDLGFSPSTNLLPIRRLGLAVGERAEVTAAWIEFPTLKVKPLPQSYRRLEHNSYHYESAGGRFKRDLTVNKEGLVTLYPGYWQMEAEL